MLYDKKWDAPTKADPESLEALIAWLEIQPANKTYRYEDQGRCMAAQYNHHIGRRYSFHELTPFDCSMELIGFAEPHTFGAALERARYAAANY